MYLVRIGRQGRVIIPAPVRKALGLCSGDFMLCRAAQNQLILKARRAAEEDLWAKFAGVRGSLSNELIRERRKDARRER